MRSLLDPRALVVPLHFEGWEHFSEGRREVAEAFAVAGLTSCLRWLEPGRPASLAVGDRQGLSAERKVPRAES